MSEYWKSTPKYWCKHCKTFVRETKLEKQNHEATPKHQGNLQRFLRDLHRGHDREQRDAQRAKDEVARLNGITAGPKDTGNTPVQRGAYAAPTEPRQAAPADRKRQLQQLAEMGIAVPEEARREMAMAGDWQTQSVTPVYDRTVQKEEDGDDKKPSRLAVGVRKRKYEGDEEKEQAGETVVKRGWGSTTRTWDGGDDDDLDALLKSTKTSKHTANDSARVPPTGAPPSEHTSPGPSGPADEPFVKGEDSGDVPASLVKHTPTESVSAPDGLLPKDFPKDEDVAESGVVFKKRKARPSRQKG